MTQRKKHYLDNVLEEVRKVYTSDDKDLGSCLNGVQRQFLCDECRDEIRGDAFEIEGEFTDSDIPTEQALMHATERA